MKPILIIMAAGMGSRYGGLKQMDPIGLNGELILDFSLFDAKKAGFEKVIFIIKEEMQEDFAAIIEKGAAKNFEVCYAFQKIENIPAGYTIPDGRTKPWGTGQAVLSAKDFIDGPFAVINADDYYGPQAFSQMYDFLANTGQNDKYFAPPQIGTPYEFSMIGYYIENTVTEHGHVARGVCKASKENLLEGVDEIVQIETKGDTIQYTKDEGKTWHLIEKGTPVSMNFWGFSLPMLKEIEERFPEFLGNAIATNPQKGEFFLPVIVNDLLLEKKATVKILYSPDKWYGVTYKEDKETVMNSIQSMQKEGKYPQSLWSR